MRTLWIECGSSQAPALRDSKVCAHCRFYYFPFRNLFYRPSGVSHVVLAKPVELRLVELCRRVGRQLVEPGADLADAAHTTLLPALEEAHAVAPLCDELLCSSISELVLAFDLT